MEKGDNNFIIIAGNIGVGKTTVAKALSQRLGYELFRERVARNPYLDKFYHDMHEWAFKLQRYFLFSRTTDHEEASNGKTGVIMDRSLYEDAVIFETNLYEQGYLSKEEHERYHLYYDDTVNTLRNPTLLIYLRASLPTLRSRIQKRNRSYEQELLDVNNPYLGQLNNLYETFYANYDRGDKMLVDANRFDVITRPQDLETIIDMVKEKIDL